ncbi:MAG: hypothetical protein KatS3mg107_1254 [Gemmataceae bacterium]|nr:MAG: hypothetical protein KatS3mg107_1254 [Gemmataceae bacterium]
MSCTTWLIQIFTEQRFLGTIGGSWRGRQLGLKKYSTWIRWWYATPTLTKVVVGVVIISGGAAGGYWLFTRSDGE